MFDVIHFADNQTHTTRALDYRDAMAKAHFIANKHGVSVTVKDQTGSNLEDEIVHPR